MEIKPSLLSSDIIKDVFGDTILNLENVSIFHDSLFLFLNDIINELTIYSISIFLLRRICNKAISYKTILCQCGP
jgi:hypothetical protein